jgi:hypothetical protein
MITDLHPSCVPPEGVTGQENISAHANWPRRKQAEIPQILHLSAYLFPPHTENRQ